MPALATTYDPRDGVPPSRLERPAGPSVGPPSVTQQDRVQKVEVDIVSVNIKPLEDRIVVKPLDAEQTTASGLVIPDTAKEKPQEGEVLAIGPGRIDDNGNRVPLDVAVGDKVIYSKYGGTEVKYSGEEYLILSARDVLAVVS
jgi:chaperonin GroES